MQTLWYQLTPVHCKKWPLKSREMVVIQVDVTSEVNIADVIDDSAEERQCQRLVWLRRTVSAA